jgi:hypothetical protein
METKATNTATATTETAATPPANAGGSSSFLDGIMGAMKAPKQQYGSIPGAAPSPGGTPPIVDATGAPIASDASTIAGPTQINTDPYDQLKKEAAIWVFGVDLAASRGLKFWSKVGEVEDFKLKDDEKNDLTIALADYFATLPQTPKMPAWIVLLVTVAMIYGAKALTAHGMRTESMKRKKTNPMETATAPAPLTVVKEAKVIKMDRRNPSRPKKKKADRKPKYDPGKPYWDQQWNSKGVRIFSPVDANENERRKINGGAPCLNCTENYAKPGKNACSAHCAGKLKKNVSVATISQS